jgi:antirestriction protein ArdC
MATETATEKKVASKDVYRIINDKVIAQLEKGIAPWRVPWTEAGAPVNLISQKAYKGMNVMLLAPLGYERNVFITENQLKDVGGTIKPGERPHMAVYWNYKDKDGAENKTPMLRYYQVYNLSQVAGILTELVPDVVREADPIAACERIIGNMPKYPSVRHKENKAYYTPLDNYINLPKQKSYANDAAYYNALFHQLVHSTGHHTHLDRMGLVQMPEHGWEAYSLEELVAEIGACYLRSLAGIASPFDETTEVSGWIPKFRKDPYLIFTAANLAQKAVDYILNVKAVEETKEEVDEALAA